MQRIWTNRPYKSIRFFADVISLGCLDANSVTAKDERDEIKEVDDAKERGREKNGGPPRVFLCKDVILEELYGKTPKDLFLNELRVRLIRIRRRTQLVRSRCLISSRSALPLSRPAGCCGRAHIEF